MNASLFIKTPCMGMAAATLYTEVIQSCATLPVGKYPLFDQLSELVVAQPQSRQIRTGFASAGHRAHTDYAVFRNTASSCRPKFVKPFEIVFTDWWYGSTLFD
jgi:hypothetical protein